MSFFVYAMIFILGTAVGSFINVLTLRLGTGLGFGGRSLCFSCGKSLSWRELIPVLSFLAQKGRCAGCKAKISWQYPLVEFMSGILFVLIIFKTGFNPSFFNLLSTVYYLFISSLLLAISVYDLKHKIIPDVLVYIFIVLSFLGLFLFFENSQSIMYTVQSFLAGPALALPFAFFWFISRGRWMGFGDAKLALGIGWFLGLSQGVAALVLSFWVGAAAGLLLIAGGAIFPLLFASSRYTIKSEMPFGPFLALGTLLAFFFDIQFQDLSQMFVFFEF